MISALGGRCNRGATYNGVSLSRAVKLSCVMLSRMALRQTSGGTCCSAASSSWMDNYLESTHLPALLRCNPEHCCGLLIPASSTICAISECAASCATAGYKLWWRGWNVLPTS